MAKRTQPLPQPSKPTSAAFWSLAAEIGLNASEARRIIGNEGHTNRQFLLSTDQASTVALLAETFELACKADTGGEGRAWLKRPNKSALFDGDSPIAFILAEGLAGLEHTNRHLKMLASGGALAEQLAGPPKTSHRHRG
jgi:hypothetical protein